MEKACQFFLLKVVRAKNSFELGGGSAARFCVAVFVGYAKFHSFFLAS
jgi:hypothetical protein